MPFDPLSARAALDASVAGRSGLLRVRMVLDENGAIRTETEPFAASPAPWRFAVSSERVSSADPLLRHKTSRRELFDSEHARRAALGTDEVIFLNERDELTEGSRTNLFLVIAGRLVTPPLDAGLLDGCLRRELIEQSVCAEAPLTRADLARADRIFLGNSLRGLIQAVAA
jgi:para-aminobenzoate synthetase/4-amino-4-deoxychorismate lyase